MHSDFQVTAVSFLILCSPSCFRDSINGPPNFDLQIQLEDYFPETTFNVLCGQCHTVHNAYWHTMFFHLQASILRREVPLKLKWLKLMNGTWCQTCDWCLHTKAICVLFPAHELTFMKKDGTGNRCTLHIWMPRINFFE